MGLMLLTLLTTSCRWGPHPLMLTDGCYYDGKTPIFKVVGHDGWVMIPGAVRRFRVKAEGNPFEAHAIFTPGFLLDGDIETDAFDEAKSQTLKMKSGTSVPTIIMNWAAYGQSDVRRGEPC